MTMDERKKRQVLIESLRALRKKAEEIEFQSAMCYSTIMPVRSLAHLCETCGTVTELASDEAVEFSRWLPYLKRSLSDLPVRVTFDASALCRTCGIGKPLGILMTTECGECGKAFTWSVSSREDRERISLLFLNHPVTSFRDMNVHGGRKAGQVIENVEYIASRLFCDSCRQQLGLSGTGQYQGRRY